MRRRTVFLRAGSPLMQTLQQQLEQIHGHAMAQVVCHQPLFVKICVRTQVSPCGIYDGQSGTGTSFL
jgi:hypothetical protein